ncbi:MAG: YjfB family protein [Tissierellaceae bacterium]|nr:YjfB family protein [Tissierellaceae bacterium]
MDVAGLSVVMNQGSASTQAGVSVLKMAMDMAELQSAQMTQIMEISTEIMEKSVNTHLGGNIDIKV